MPYTITSPETKDITQKILIDNDSIVEVTKSRTLDTVQIEESAFMTPINNPTGVRAIIKWSIGYNDGGVFFPVQRGTNEFAGSTILTAMTQPATGQTHYADLKVALYSLLADNGVIPAGVIS